MTPDLDLPEALLMLGRAGIEVAVNPTDPARLRSRPATAGGSLKLGGALHASDFGQEDAKPKGGRPTRRFQLAPTVTVTETPVNHMEDVGNGDRNTTSTLTDGRNTSRAP
jgi:hypothetical protein